MMRFRNEGFENKVKTIVRYIAEKSKTEIWRKL